MTSENEKKKEDSRTVADFFVKLRDEEMYTGKDFIADLERELDEVMSRLPRTRGLEYSCLALQKRFLATLIWLHHEGVIARSQAAVLALHLAELEDKTKAKPPDTSLHKELEEAKKKLDEHVAKRLDQLLSEKGHKAIYG